MAQLLSGTRIYGTGTVDTQLLVNGTEQSISTTTGALEVVGGVGIGRNLYVGGTIFGSLNGNITGITTTATQVYTALQTANASYYPTFVDANNTSATGESLYTTGTFVINPQSGNIGIGGALSASYKVQITNTLAGVQADKTIFNIADMYNAGANGQFFKIMGGASGINLLSGWGALNLGARTADGNDTFTSHLTIVGSGNVGIGATSPGAKLDIKQSGTNWYDGVKIVRSTTDTQRLVFGNTSGASWITSVDTTAGSNNQLVFGRSTDGTTFTESARFDSAGNFGIGTTAPGARLNIATSETKAQNATVAVFATSTLGVNDFQLLLSRGTNTYYALQAVEQGVAYRDLVLQYNGGNVGIGTTAPNTKLDVAGAKNVAAINITQTAPAVANAFDDYVAIDFRMYNEVFPVTQFTGNPSARISSYLESGSNIFGLDFWTRNGAGAFGKVMRLTGAGGLSFGASGTAVGTAGQILQSNGNTSPTWINASSIVATTAANIVGGLSGQLLYQSAPSTTAFVSTSTVGNVLVTNGTSAPAFQNTLTLSGTTVSTNTISGAFQVVGGVGIGGNLNVGGNEIITGNAAINGGSLTTNVSTFNLVNTTATTVNFAGAGTTISIGASTGNTTVKNNLVVVGNMTVQGTTTIVDSTVTNISDPIITLGGNAGNTAPSVDDNKDRGVAFKWYDGGVAKVGFFGFQDSTKFFTFFTSATITNEVVSAAGGSTKGALDAYLAGGSAQSLVYQSSPNVTAFLAASTAGYILQTNSTGSAPTWVAPSGLTAGNATNATYLLSSDDRTKSPSDDNSGSLRFGFTSFGNNNSSPYADYLHLRSYTDATGGNDNLVMFRKDAIGMRIWQQAWGTSTAYTSYKDVAFTDSNITGAAAQVNTVLQTANASYYPTFVPDNNATAAAESLYTTSSFAINPSTGASLHGAGPGFVDSYGTANNTYKLIAYNVATTSTGVDDVIRVVTKYNAAVGASAAVGNGPAIVFAGGIGDNQTRDRARLVAVFEGGNMSGMAIHTQSAADTIVERIRVASSNASVPGALLVGTSVLTNTNGVLQVNGTLGMAPSTQIRQWTNADGGTLQFFGTQVVVGPTNSTGYGYAESGLLASVSNGDGAILLDTGRANTLASGWARFRVVNQAGVHSIIQLSRGTTSTFYADTTNAFVGIGYTVQQSGAALSVNGGVYVNGTVTATNFVGAFTGAVTGAASQVSTIRQTANATYYPTFVDTNNASAIAESLYTTSSFAINPSTGNVGIGTISPGYKLNVAQVAATSGSTVALTGSTTGWNRYYVSNTSGDFFAGVDASTSVYSGTAYAGNIGTTGATPLQFITAGATRATIDSSGNVGIGILTPAAKIHVIGSESRFGGVASGYISIYDNSGRVGYIQANGGTDLRIAAEGGTTPMTFLVNGSERARINTTGNVQIGTQTDSGYKLEVNGSFAAVTKSFVINHPTRPGMKLRYGSLEGPENGVYVRGKLTGSNKIELPEYWTKLVDPDSITVSLTSIGKHQNLYVADIADNVVTVGNGNILSKAINCFYVVYGERADVDKLVVEI